MLRKLGIAMSIRMIMMLMTMSSSIRVKPLQPVRPSSVRLIVFMGLLGFLY